jgi:hypothetical protein
LQTRQGFPAASKIAVAAANRTDSVQSSSPEYMASSAPTTQLEQPRVARYSSAAIFCGAASSSRLAAA